MEMGSINQSVNVLFYVCSQQDAITQEEEEEEEEDRNLYISKLY